MSTQFRSLSDRELVTMAESLPTFDNGIAREVLLRLAHHAHHLLAEQDAGRVRTSVGEYAQYNARGEG